VVAVAESDKISLTTIKAGDDEVINDFIIGIVRKFHVGAMLHDDLDDNGNPVISLFGDDENAVMTAQEELIKENS
jgi:hypothetical protein